MADAGKIVITPKGAYSSTKTYEWLDEVSYNGNAYVALKTVTGVTPSDDGVNWRLFMSSTDVDANVLVPKFTEASTRSNIVSGENLSTMFGKIKKWFTDLKSHAFKDLVNNLTTSTTGSALDASQGKVLQDEVDGANRNLEVDIYNVNDVVVGKYVIDKDCSTGASTSWAYIPINVNGLDKITISALGGSASWNKHYFNDGTTIPYNNADVTVEVPSTASILYLNVYKEYTDLNTIKITTNSNGKIIAGINESLANYGLDNKSNKSWVQGVYGSAGTLVSSYNYGVADTNYHTCSSDNIVSVKMDNLESVDIVWYNDTTMLNRVSASATNGKAVAVAPTNTTQFLYSVRKAESGDALTPNNVKDVYLYVGNEIDSIKNDLSTHTHNYAGSDTPGGSATYALQANKDGAGNVIDATYINKTYMRNYGAGSIAFGNNMFIGIFNGDIICSSDGQEWEVNFEPNLFSLLDNDEILLGITYGNEKFVSFSNKGCSYVSSDNGNTWTKTQTIITV